MIQEVIVVEGRDDITAVKQAVEAEVIAVGGSRFGEKTLRQLKNIAMRRGMILLMDPDYAGDRIRERISRAIPDCKHAFLPREEAIKDGDIGVENARAEAIRRAIEKARPMTMEAKETFTYGRLYRDGLIGENGKQRRHRMGEILGIGYGNGKQFLQRLNHFGIEEEEYEKALEDIRD